MKHPVLAALIAALILTPLVALRAEPGEHHKYKKEAREMKKNLDLTPEQETKWKALRDSEKTALEPLREQHKAITQKLKEQTEKKAPDAEIKATLAELQANKKAMHDQMLSFRDQRNAILTPTQQAKLEVRKGKHGMMGEKHDMK